MHLIQRFAGFYRNYFKETELPAVSQTHKQIFDIITVGIMGHREMNDAWLIFGE